MIRHNRCCRLTTEVLMNVALTPDLEELVNSKLKEGRYETADEVIREGLRLLKERDDHLNWLRAEIRLGFDDIERGDYTEHDQSSTKALAEDIKRRGRLRLAASKRKPARR
jgi:antitoxin ParD1/3/4